MMNLKFLGLKFPTIVKKFIKFLIFFNLQVRFILFYLKIFYKYTENNLFQKIVYKSFFNIFKKILLK